jgi:hypothetical protein
VGWSRWVRDAGARAAAGGGVGAVGDEFAQGGEHVLGEGGDGVVVVEVFGVGPTQFETVLFDSADDVEKVRAGGVGVGVSA